MARLFFALWPPRQVAQALHAWARDAQTLTGGRVTREPTIHLTLAFLGDVSGQRTDALIECARRVRGEPMVLDIEDARRWRHNGIVWAGPKAAPVALARLAAGLESALGAAGFRTEQREFKAHVTLLRKTLRGESLPPFESVSWRAEEFVLVRSILAAEGPAYATLARFGLDGVRPH